MESYYLILVIIVIISIVIKANRSTIRGKRGERLVENRLRISNAFGNEGKILRNIYVPKPNGETSEIDALYITQKGIFVIESKNYSGYIFGSEDNQKWTVTLYTGKNAIGRSKVEKIQFYNPIKQNKTHIKYLDQYLGNNYPYFSIIAFSERCELMNINTHSQDVYVCHRNSINSIIGNIWNCYPDCISNDEINEIKNKLSNNYANEQTKAQHIEQIRDKMDRNDICPVCGSKLVLRTAKTGRNSGRQFYGCSSYPKCKYTKNLL